MSEDFANRFSRRKYCQSLGIAGAAGLIDLAGVASASSHEQRGNGGYRTSLPPDASEPQETIWTTSNFGDDPVPTNDWWSSLVWNAFSERVFAQPLLVRAQETGLGVGYPTEWVDGSTTVMAAEEDLTISHAETSGFQDARLDDHGDWSVAALFGDGTATSLRTRFAQGSPFVFCEYAGGGTEIAFESVPEIFADDGNVLGVTVNGNHYGLFAPEGTTWVDVESATISNDLGNGGYCTVALLPRPESLERYERYAYNVVTETRVEWEYDRTNATVSTTYRFETDEFPESNATGTIAALHPHQWKYSEDPTLNETYTSQRGEMRLVTGTSFSTTYDYGGMLPFLPDEGEYTPDELRGYVDEIEATFPAGNDTYNAGKEFGRLVESRALAEQVGMDAAADELIGAIRDGLERWLQPDSDEEVFYYNDNWKTLLGYPESHGSASSLSDHHFHYGYFVRAAAEIARTNPDWAVPDEWGEMIEHLIRDYANPSREDSMYPFARNFSPYCGHSWAEGGGAEFADGNNQESSSEALNAYSAMIQWGEYTGNDELRDFGIYLYTTELHAVHEYWFDVDDENHPDSWDHDTAGMVWGNGYAYATWWTDDEEAIHGINWLPLSGYSLHLGWDAAGPATNYDELVETRGTDQFDYWPDLMWMYRAFSDAEDAAEKFEARKNSYQVEAGETRAHTYHWIHNLRAMGSPDGTVTADTPFYQVFSDGSERTYVAYNASDSSTTVTFSDETTLTVPANSMATSSGVDNGDGDSNSGDGADTGNSGDGDRNNSGDGRNDRGTNGRNGSNHDDGTGSGGSDNSGNSSEKITVGEHVAQDSTGDGRYNDITGDGETTHEDVNAFFEHLESDDVQSNPEKFDFDGDGQVGSMDVLELLRQI
ncbi:glycosyl hydrolase [Natrinema halophilum]|uniref:glucan endo-1,3-beta-D-glucosidase n=1 Tax=Natrinema halophilum TaxID=1699371 RepID=A0A7D5GHY5_9EURY|nr:glycosyl hydrolase [Natrinema halophilum]QLG49514.1 glycoside hydrolase family 81 [Natrinema halophilum]